MTEGHRCLLDVFVQCSRDQHLSVSLARDFIRPRLRAAGVTIFSDILHSRAQGPSQPSLIVCMASWHLIAGEVIHRLMDPRDVEVPRGYEPQAKITPIRTCLLSALPDKVPALSSLRCCGRSRGSRWRLARRLLGALVSLPEQPSAQTVPDSDHVPRVCVRNVVEEQEAAPRPEKLHILSERGKFVLAIDEAQVDFPLL